VSRTSAADLKVLALDVGREIAGPDAIGDVDVGEAVIYNRLAIQFTYLFHRNLSRIDPGTARIKIDLRLADELENRGESNAPLLTMLDQRDWDQRSTNRSA